MYLSRVSLLFINQLVISILVRAITSSRWIMPELIVKETSLSPKEHYYIAQVC